MILLATASAHAGGIGRPNTISARGVGMGGAWTAWADDATAVYFNPAAMDAIDPHVMAGGELVLNPRSYTPVADDGTRGADQSTTIVAPLPAVGVVGRFWYDGEPSRFTLGAGVWNTFGGKVDFPVTGNSAIDATQDAVIEANAGASLRISDKLAIGGTFRLGYGLFSVDATKNPFDAHMSASGLGVGMAWGLLLRPTEDMRVGLAWRSALHVTTTGTGTVEVVPGTPIHTPIEQRQTWPQQVSAGFGRRFGAVKLALQVDWTQWSQIHAFVVTFPTGMVPDQTYPADWSDTWTARIGGEYAASSSLALRAGVYFDSKAVPDRTIERQYIDNDKLGVAAGVGYRAGDWRVDAAVDVVMSTTRKVPNNNAGTMMYPADRNIAPGDYAGTLVTFELAGARSF